MSEPIESAAVELIAAAKYAALKHYVTWALGDAERNIQASPLHPEFFLGQRSAVGAMQAFIEGLESGESS